MAKSFIFLRSSCEMESVPLEEKKKRKKRRRSILLQELDWRGWQFLDQAKRLYGAGPRPDTRATPPASPLI